MPSAVCRRRVSPALLFALAFAAACVSAQAQDAVAPDGGTLAAVAPYPGEIALEVDATDFAHRVYRVRERIPVRPGPLKLWYPKWIPGNHAPTGPINQLAGLEMTAGGRVLAWRRDPLDVYAFLVDVPDGVDLLEVAFDSLSPTAADQGRVAMTAELMSVQWSRLLLYPAGHDARAIRVRPALRLPAGWGAGTALETEGDAGADGALRFRPLALADLVDSPVYAGRHVRRFDLDPGAAAPVRLDAVADAPELLEVAPAVLDAHRALVAEADRVFGARPYLHYDFLVALSGRFDSIGLEHRQSSENGVAPGYLRGEDPFTGRSLLPHEYVHAWNGKAVRPALLWTPDYNTPMRNELLWVYEGQTEYWAWVLAARSGLYAREQALDALAELAATAAHRSGRAWRDLQDTVYQGIVDFNDAPQAWEDWQRAYDFYDEGVLLWLDVDTRLRASSHGRRSLDDFARGFFGSGHGTVQDVRRYGFDDVADALARVQPADWAGLLRTRIGAHDAAPLDGLARAGWRLVYDARPNLAVAANEEDGGYDDFRYSAGLRIDRGEGKVRDVLWDGPAYRAGLAKDMQVVAVDGKAYDAGRLRRAIAAAQGGSGIVELLVRDGDAYRTLRIEARDGLRQPHLERIPGTPDLLDAIVAPRRAAHGGR